MIADDGRPRTIDGFPCQPGTYDGGWCEAVVTKTHTTVRCKGCGAEVTMPNITGGTTIEIDHVTEPLCPTLVRLSLGQALANALARVHGANPKKATGAHRRSSTRDRGTVECRTRAGRRGNRHQR